MAKLCSAGCKLATKLSVAAFLTRRSITTPNGSLVAYTAPADVRSLRDQAALVLVTWREQIEYLRTESTSPEADGDAHGTTNDLGSSLHTMIMEFDSRNVLVRQIQPKLLLVLEGGVPPGRRKSLHITIESLDGTKRPGTATSVDASQVSRTDDTNNAASHAAGSPSARSLASTTASVSQRRNNILDLHRRKLDALTEVIRQDFEKAQFSMPTDPDDRFF